jgi:general secretion pathway protein I
MNSINWRGNSGFTLLEVMIALVIVGTALIACLTLTNRCVHSQEQVQRITAATMLAQHKMSELEAAARRGELDSITTEGTWTPPYSQYSWDVTFNSTAIEGVQQVSVAIIWGDRARNEEVSIDSFLFNQ